MCKVFTLGLFHSTSSSSRNCMPREVLAYIWKIIELMLTCSYIKNCLQQLLYGTQKPYHYSVVKVSRSSQELISGTCIILAPPFVILAPPLRTVLMIIKIKLVNPKSLSTASERFELRIADHK